MTFNFLQELGRKLIHIIVLLVLCGYVIVEKTHGKQIALVGIVSLLILFLILEYFRLELDLELPIFNWIIRAKEHRKPYGTIYFLLSTIICLAVFDFRIALAALLMTVFGDMTAALIGKWYGKTLIFKNKTLTGGIVELVINLILGFIILRNFYIILAMAFTATIVETFVDELDDNLVVPLFSGFVGQMLIFLI